MECARRFAPTSLHTFAFTYPTAVLAMVLGLCDERVAEWTGDFVRSVTAGAPAAAILRGSDGARHLWQAFEQTGIRDSLEIANAIGLLFQTYDATAALIANTLLAYASGCATREEPLERVIAEVVRCDSPVQNTRRFAATTATIMHTSVSENDQILVLLAAANRDPLANGRIYTFGIGPHACPGARIACAIARAGVAYLLEHRADFEQLAAKGYRPSPNIRMPDLA
ncbi:MAG: hypothetical protein ABR584_03390 [Candidatus Baltobacteraceae bacterium]